MKELTAVAEQGRITLPEHFPLPDGSVVRVVWDEKPASIPLEAEAWTEEEVQADLVWRQAVCSPNDHRCRCRTDAALVLGRRFPVGIAHVTHHRG